MRVSSPSLTGKKVFSVESDVMTVTSNYPVKKGAFAMRVHYDQEVDAVYIQMDDSIPDGVVETKEGVNIDTTEDGRLTGIEILDASKK